MAPVQCAAVVVVFAVLGVVVIFAIAAVVIGREAFRLGHQPLSAIADVEEAVHHVADNLPAQHAARLTYDEVRQLVHWYVAHLRRKGITPVPGRELVDLRDAVVVDDDALASVIERVEAAELDVSDDEVLAVVDLVVAYLADVGALGPPAISPPLHPPPPPPNASPDEGRDE
jgi:hypothetical protein